MRSVVRFFTMLLVLFSLTTIFLGYGKGSEIEAGYYQCNPYTCGSYICGSYQCGWRSCNPHPCNCRQVCNWLGENCITHCDYPCWGVCPVYCNRTCYNTCYETCCDELNIPQPQATSISMVVDGDTYSLSTNPDDPTLIDKYIDSDSTVSLSMPSRTAPSTTQGLGYTFWANNYGLGEEWIRWNNCSSPYAEDFCIESTSNTVNFSPSSLSVEDTLLPGAEGKISGMYYTINECDTTKIYSIPLEGYYRMLFDPNTEIKDVCDWDVSLLAGDPNCVNPDDPTEGEIVCPMIPDEDCTKKEIFTNVGGPYSYSPKGCYTEDYTGLTQINNPLEVRIGATDEDGVEDIRGVVIWFSRSDIIPERTEIVDDYSATDPGEMGIMIGHNNLSWDEPLIYGLNSDNTWALLGDNTLLNSDGDAIARVSNLLVTEGLEVLTFEFDVELLSNHTGEASGEYAFNSVVLDQYMLLGNGRVYLRSIQSYFNWGIDLVDPVIEEVTQSINGPTQIYLNLELDGTGSKITDYVLSGYRDGGDIISEINLISPVGYDSIALRTGEDYPQGCLPGVPGGNDCALNTWRFPDINVEDYATDPEYILVDIGQNQGGAVVIYATAYDQACNDSIVDHVLDLRPWIATKGGVMYSQGSMGSNAKDFSEEGELDKFYNIDPASDTTTLRNYSGQQILNEMTTGTELISSRNQAITDLIHYDTIKAVRANNIYDSNEKKNYWFEYFKRKLDQQLAFENTPITQTTIAVGCPTGSTCVMYSDESIDVPEGYVCDAKTLIMSGGSITVTPTVESSGGGLNGCIFLAKDRIIIKEGTHVSSGGDIVKYDYIEGFFIAEDQILIKLEEDLAEPIRDGLEIKGGLVAFGRDSTNSSALLIERNLRLFSYMNPTVVVTWDVKYAKLSEIFFGVEAAMYKQEVGFKAF